VFLIIKTVYGVWHLPGYILVSAPSGGGAFDLAFVVTNTISIMAMTATWTWVVNYARTPS
jgi:hypothetical protein